MGKNNREILENKRTKAFISAQISIKWKKYKESRKPCYLEKMNHYINCLCLIEEKLEKKDE